MTNIENINISINEHIEEILRLERQSGRAYNAGDIEHYFQLSTKINMRIGIDRDPFLME